MKKRKSHFLLLELLLAIFLLGLALVPLVEIPSRVLQKALHRSLAIEAYRLADLSFAEFKEQLYAHQIPWETIVESRDKRVVWKKEHEVAVELPLSLKSKLLRKEDFSAKTRVSQDGTEYCLLTYRVSIKPKNKLKIFRTKKKEKPPKKNEKAREFFYFKILLKKGDNK